MEVGRLKQGLASVILTAGIIVTDKHLKSRSTEVQVVELTGLGRYSILGL